MVPMRTIVLAFISLLMLYGCLGFSRDYTNYYVTGINRIAVSDPSYYAVCKTGSCVCMLCQNGTDDIPFFNFFSSMVGGSCHFEQNCTQQKVDEFNVEGAQGSGLEIRQFMLGQGPSFADFGDANPYCKNKLTMAVQWLTGSADTEYSSPDPSRAICLLAKGIMPVYVLYSDGENIDFTRTREIAHVLGTQGDDFTMGRLTSGPVGPVVVTTEINYDVADAAAVADQVRAINEGCDNNRAGNEIHCLVAVAPKMNDFAALEAVMSQPGIADQVDLVAYGVDHRYAHSCIGESIVQQASNFSQYSLYTWGKPTIIPYVMFDSVGTDVDDSCQWRPDTARHAYEAFFPGAVIELPQKGVIGIAPYSFNSTSYGSVGNPLGCVDCAVAKDTFRLNAWYGGCQAFTELTRLSPGGSEESYADARMQLVFPNESAGFCDFNQQWASAFRSTSFAGGDFGSPQVGAAGEPEDISLRCDACLTWTMNRSPFAFESPSLGADALHSACYNMSPLIDYWANQRNVDPMLMRSVIYIETGGTFDPCSAAKSCRADYHGEGCFAARTEAGASEGYGTGYNEIYDPSGACSDKLENAIDKLSREPEWRWSGLGLTQSLEPPYDFWPAEFRADGVDGPYAYVFQNASDRGRSPVLEYARACNPTNFNPFNATDSICVGAMKVEDYLGQTRDWIRRNRPLLNWRDTDFEKDNAFAGYVAMNMYAGFWNGHMSSNPACVDEHGDRLKTGDCWATQFRFHYIVTREYCTPPEGEALPPECSSRGTPDASRCYGYTDFVKYVHDCELRYLPPGRQVDPGSIKMGLYYYLRDNCDNSYCPDWKQLYKSDPAFRASHPLPPSGSIYIPD